MSFCNIYDYNDLKRKFKSGKVIGYARCESEFEEEDKAFALETGLCPYCHKEMIRGLTQ